ncbi:MAG TPA: GrpB family protein, partial [Candidatus Limnocylindrales bacterium]
MTDPAKTQPSRTKAEIEALTVGEVTPLEGKIVLAESDPSWPVLYVREDARIRAALGDRVLAIEHTGSTSVPGLAAKPIVDMTMIVADVTDEAAWIPDLEAAGYVLR